MTQEFKIVNFKFTLNFEHTVDNTIDFSIEKFNSCRSFFQAYKHLIPESHHHLLKELPKNLSIIDGNLKNINHLTFKLENRFKGKAKDNSEFEQFFIKTLNVVRLLLEEYTHTSISNIHIEREDKTISSYNLYYS